MPLEMKNCNTYIKPILLVKYFTGRFWPLDPSIYFKKLEKSKGTIHRGDRLSTCNCNFSRAKGFEPPS